MAIYAKGKLAFGFCDRTGFRYPLNRLVNEIRNGVPTGFRVGDDEQTLNPFGPPQGMSTFAGAVTVSIT